MILLSWESEKKEIDFLYFTTFDGNEKNTSKSIFFGQGKFYRTEGNHIKILNHKEYLISLEFPKGVLFTI